MEPPHSKVEGIKNIYDKMTGIADSGMEHQKIRISFLALHFPDHMTYMLTPVTPFPHLNNGDNKICLRGLV